MTDGRKDRVALVIGSLALDAIVGGAGETARLGGVVTYAGITYARHGVRSHVCANVALQDRHHLSALATEGVTLHLGVSSQTTRCVNTIDGDRRQQIIPTVARPITAQDIAAVRERDITIVHLGPLHPQDLEVASLAALDDRAHVVCDIQGLTRNVVDGVVEHRVTVDPRPFLEAADTVKGDSMEVELILAAEATDRTGLIRRFGIAELIETRGSAGGVIHTRDGGSCRYHAVEVDGTVDPTGAGDVFLAAFVWARRCAGQTLAVAAAHAAGLAARQVCGNYITPELLALDEVG